MSFLILIIIVAVGIEALMLCLVGICTLKSLKYEFSIKKHGILKQFKIIKADYTDGDENPLYTAKLDLIDENGNVAIARIFAGVCTDLKTYEGKIVQALEFNGNALIIEA